MMSSEPFRKHEKDMLSPVQYLKGVGPRRAELFKKLGISTIGDLFSYFPRRYEDRSTLTSLSDISPGETVVVSGTVLTKGVRRMRATTVFELVLDDGTGTLHCCWFNQPYLNTVFKTDQHCIVTGKVELYNRRLQLNSPEYEILEEDTEDTIHTGRIVPVYPLTDGLYQRSLRSMMKQLIDTHLDLVTEELPADVIKRNKLMGRKASLRNIHFPETLSELEEARRRLVFEEFYNFECEVARNIAKRLKLKNNFRIINGDAALREFIDTIPFSLTGAQHSAIKEIKEDMQGTVPMSRLLQGDVGSGKTVVAAAALLLIARSGAQGALLVPTELLAYQHFATVKELLEPLNITVGLLTGAHTQNEKKEMLERIRNGSIDVVIGTHALIQESVAFKALGLVIIDEQHKFGVEQRARLVRGEAKPHVLVMTATPIPRTLGLIVYGDLDNSVLTELPFGQRRVTTYWITQKKQKEVFEFVKKKCKEGDQAYIIFPLVEETEKTDLRAAVDEYEKMRVGIFKDYAVGLIHGKIDKEQRNDIMRKFKEKKIDLIVSTSVIEVGIDNPNASIMIIEHADRFGLSQLHQMRGRVGRGEKESFCFLFGDPASDIGKMRLRLMTKTNDGFKIAEEDLYLRGPGDFLGTRQSGLPVFKLADIVKDVSILTLAKKEAFACVGIR